MEDTHKSKTEPEAAFKDRKSTRLNSSHQIISYAVFCLIKKQNKKKKKKKSYAAAGIAERNGKANLPRNHVELIRVLDVCKDGKNKVIN